jgi:predicted N-acyltransferase
MMTTRVLATISDIAPQEWNAIVGRDRMICRHEYLEAVEQSGINDCRYFYPMVYDGARIVAHACVYFISTELDVFAQGALKRGIDWVRSLWREFLILRSVECGTPVGLGSTISFREGTNKVEALIRIVRETERLAGKRGVGVVLLRDFHDDELPLCDCLRDFGYVRIQNLPTAHFQVRWNSFDGYLAAMRSDYRRKVNTRIRQFEESGGSIESVASFTPHSKCLARLLKNAYDHAVEYRREVLKPDFFQNIDQHLGERSSVLLARVHGEPAGFSLLLHDDETLTQLFCGLDYAYNEDHAVYFNMLYRIIGLGVTNGYRKIDFGITTLQPKMDIGATVVPLHMYMKDLRPMHCNIVPKLFQLMTPKPPGGSRRVFKQ